MIYGYDILLSEFANDIEDARKTKMEVIDTNNRNYEKEVTVYELIEYLLAHPRLALEVSQYLSWTELGKVARRIVEEREQLRA